MSQPHFEASVRMRFTLPKVGTWSPPGLPQLESSIARVKTPRLEVFFTLLKRFWSVDVEQKWLRMSHSDICSTSYGRKKGRESNWQFDSRPLKVGNQPKPDVCKWSATHHWKALEEIYKFSLDLIPIRGLSRELWVPKVPGVQSETVSGLLLGSPETRSHSDAGVVGQCREYYMGEGGGFPRVRAVVSQVSLCCLWLVPTPIVFLKVN
jgi:hypothetical protein